MKKIFFALLSITLICGLTHAESKNQNLKITSTVSEKKQSNELDLNQFKNMNADSNSSDQQIQLTASCKSKNGLVFKHGDAGFESCSKESSTDRNLDKIKWY